MLTYAVADVAATSNGSYSAQGVADGVVTSENTSASVTLAVLGANNTSGTQHMTVLNWIVRKEY